jgi:DNA-binding MarR family transcriptional regulator
MRILERVPTEILLELYPRKLSYGLKISKKIDRVISGVINNIKTLEEAGLVEQIIMKENKNDKRRRYIKLTDKGVLVTRELKGIMEKVEYEN